jgi:uncharacterized protein (TIGR00369 family)
MDGILCGLKRPPCAELLGWRLVRERDENGWTIIGFDGRPEFANPAGFIQGGFLAAMLDDTMGPAALSASGGTLYTSSIDMTVSFLAPARPGAILGYGRAVQLGKTVGFLEAYLTDAGGLVLARATSSARLVPVDRLPNP